MALQALNASKNSKVSIVIQPVAIDYSEKDEFRSDLCIHYCEPVTVSSQDFQIKDIMLGVRESLEKNLATFFSWDEKRNWRFLFELAYERPPVSSREFRVFVEKYREGFDNSPDILARIQTIRRLMQVRNLSPSQMSWAKKHHTKKEHFIIILKHIWFYLFISIPFRFLGALVWGVPYKLCESLSNMSPYGRDVKATMKITHGFYIFPAWSLIIAFLLSSYLNDIFPEFNLLILWLLSFAAGPIFLLLSVVLSTTLYFFPGYWELAKLRLFFPRVWTELMLEWKEITELVVNKMDG